MSKTQEETFSSSPRWKKVCGGMGAGQHAAAVRRRTRARPVLFWGKSQKPNAIGKTKEEEEQQSRARTRLNCVFVLHTYTHTQATGPSDSPPPPLPRRRGGRGSKTPAKGRLREPPPPSRRGGTRGPGRVSSVLVVSEGVERGLWVEHDHAWNGSSDGQTPRPHTHTHTRAPLLLSCLQDDTLLSHIHTHSLSLTPTQSHTHRPLLQHPHVP